MLRDEQPVSAGISRGETTSSADSLADAIRALAAASQAQSESMLSLARSTAESVRLAAGSYVFQLRDRFDDLLPATQVGASESSWEVAEFPDAFSQVVFHPGDQATANLRIAVSQCPVRRVVNMRWSHLPEGCRAADIEVAAATLSRDVDGRVHLDSDVSLFIDAPLVVDVGDLEPGVFVRTATLSIDVTDHRPEGCVARVDVEITLAAVVVTDEDGIGLDGARIECMVRPERRTYFLDKVENLPLQLPDLR
jgi:hypothetical protein